MIMAGTPRLAIAMAMGCMHVQRPAYRRGAPVACAYIYMHMQALAEPAPAAPSCRPGPSVPLQLS